MVCKKKILVFETYLMLAPKCRVGARAINRCERSLDRRKAKKRKIIPMRTENQQQLIIDADTVAVVAQPTIRFPGTLPTPEEAYYHLSYQFII